LKRWASRKTGWKFWEVSRFYVHNGYRVTLRRFHPRPFTTRPQIREVAEVLQVPVRIFLDSSRLRIEKGPYNNNETNVYFYTYGTHQIWGLTARIIKDFLETLNGCKE
jgi:hypothetical protein